MFCTSRQMQHEQWYKKKNKKGDFISQLWRIIVPYINRHISMYTCSHPLQGFSSYFFFPVFSNLLLVCQVFFIHLSFFKMDCHLQNHHQGALATTTGHQNLLKWIRVLTVNQKVYCTFKIVVVLFKLVSFLAFSLLSPPSLLKRPNQLPNVDIITRTCILPLSSLNSTVSVGTSVSAHSHYHRHHHPQYHKQRNKNSL